MSKPFGLQITENEYRKLNLPSYSLLSDIETDGPVVLYRPRVDISLDEPVIIGSIVDNYLTDGDNIKKTFVVPYIPSDKPKQIIFDLIEQSLFLPNPTDLLHKDNKEHIDKLCIKYDYFKTYATRIKYLSKFKKFIEVMNAGHIEQPFIITNYQKSQADRVISAVQNTFPFFNYRKNLGQVKLTGFINGQKLKVMFDMILVDKANKRLIPFDLKTGIESYEEFITGNFITFNYYIQASLYKEVLLQNIKDSVFDGWAVEDFRFLYCSRMIPQPMIFKVVPEMHKKALEGFTINGIYKKGLYELVEEFKFYQANPRNRYRKDYVKSKGNRLILEKDIIL